MSKARDIASAAPAPSTVSATEIGYLDGVTSAIQTQIDAKAPSSTAVTLTGTQTLTNKTLTNPVIASVVNNTLTSTTGDMIYASAANTPARLGIGSSAQVLTVSGGIPSWATPSSGGMTLINSGGTTLTGASVTISSIPATYNDLRIIVRNFRPATDGSALVFRMNGDATSSRHLTRVQMQEDAVGFNTEYITITRAADNGTSNGLTATTIFDYANTSTWKICQTHASITTNQTTTTVNNVSVSHGYYNQTGAISSLEFRCDSGNFTSGTVFVYGVK
jgi:hypothetical protein